MGVDADEKVNYLSLDDYNGLAELTESGKFTEKIAVVYAEGDVVYNSPTKGMIDNTRYLKILTRSKRQKHQSRGIEGQQWRRICPDQRHYLERSNKLKPRAFR